MRNYLGYIIDYSDGNLTESKRKWFENELGHNQDLKDSFLLFKQVNDAMRGKFDLDEVQNDPELKRVVVYTNGMVSDFNENPEKYNRFNSFIENSINGSNNDAELQKSLDRTRKEANEHKINGITKEWVDEWHSRDKKADPKANSRKAFIISALEDDAKVDITPKREHKSSIAIRIAVFATAAMVATLIAIRTLSPSNSPDNLYQQYYKPLSAYTSTTRNSSSKIDPFTSAVEKYKLGQYQVAGTMFSNLISEEPSNISIRFFSGITQLQLGDYAQSIALLNAVVLNNGEYKKEAQWYLGLAYLKMGEKEKATRLLTELSQSKGFYQNLANDLLSRLE